MQKFALRMIISGGQTGADRAALDFARNIGIYGSGWCPQGRRAEDGVIPEQYQMIEASSPIYQHRTRLNVKDSDATLIFTGKNSSRGTTLTIKCCQLLKKPFLVANIAEPAFSANTINLKDPDSGAVEHPGTSELSYQVCSAVLKWLHHFKPKVLNIAGPRASECPSATEYVFRILEKVICPTAGSPPIWPPQQPFTPKFRIFW